MSTDTRAPEKNELEPRGTPSQDKRRAARLKRKKAKKHRGKHK